MSNLVMGRAFKRQRNTMKTKKKPTVEGIKVQQKPDMVAMLCDLGEENEAAVPHQNF